MTVTRRTIGFGIGLALLVVVAAGLRPVLKRVEWFRVRRVEVTGATYLDPREVARVLGLRRDASIFDDLDPLRDRVLAVPGVRRVEVSWRLPGALVVDVTEFEPVALARTQGRLALVDRRARVLPFDPSRAPTDLPVAVADPAVTGLMESIREADPDLFGLVVAASRDRSTVVIETAQQRILFRVGAGAKDVIALAAVRSELRRRGMAVAELDARFEGRVVVRGRRG
ncbi:MAG: cell division protein FtsQ/DivIB [Gemmatimonadales bacterium]